ncbi:potassium channel AKT1-like [Mercurialis annua]|uniref:potassium channel AKT1-like n=1 Tax=Mercurialis annua TaxID=3986 RepID=UPI00215FF389|nr:potassium channel AKT1-like [Mercurialis annua]
MLMRKKGRRGLFGGQRDYSHDDEGLVGSVHDTELDDGSHFSITGEILPSLGAKPARSHQLLRPFIISPFDPHYRKWEKFLVFLVFYTAWASPFVCGFLEKPTLPLTVIDNVVNTFFAIDIVLTFCVAYLDKSSYLLIDNRKKIALKYAKTWFFCDVISTIPSELVRTLPDRIQKYGYFIMVFRLWRIWRVSRYFARLEKDRKFNYIWIRCLKLICVTLFVIHIAGCSYYFLAEIYGNPSRTWLGLVWQDYRKQKLWVRYVTSLYWSITTLTNTGYGDIHAVNEFEMIFVMLYMLFDLGLTSYLIGNMTNLVVHATGRTRQFRDTINAASSFSQRNQLPVGLQDQMIAHLSLKYRTDSEGLHQQETIDSLPKAIRSSIKSHLFNSLVNEVYLFRGVSKDLLFQLVAEMKAEYFPPREDVILQNEAPADMYILVTGAVELIVKTNEIEQVIGEEKTRGAVMGEVGLLCYRPQMFTVRTKRLSQLLRMNRTAFLSIVQSNVGDGRIIMNNLLQHLTELKDPMMGGILAEIQQMLARGRMKLPRGRMKLPLTLCFAAMRGDDLLLHQLLIRGSDPNELDNNGRTALHIAASNGAEHCVMLLLEYGADPNMKDSQGNVPLWEALLGKHESVVKLLGDNGATLSCGDVDQFALADIEQNNLDLLKEIVNCGGDVTRPTSSGTIPLHTAISDGNIEMVKFLLEQGADVDTPDVDGWTARDLADHQGHEEIQALIQNTQTKEKKHVPTIPKQQGVTYLGKHIVKHSSEPTISILNADSMSSTPRTIRPNSCQRRRVDSFNNSLFGFMSGANASEVIPSASDGAASFPSLKYPGRVTISCPEKGAFEGKLVLLPKSLDELLAIGAKKFGFSATKILTKEGAEIEDIELIRDDDHLVLVSSRATGIQRFRDFKHRNIAYTW